MRQSPNMNLRTALLNRIALNAAFGSKYKEFLHPRLHGKWRSKGQQIAPGAPEPNQDIPAASAATATTKPVAPGAYASLKGALLAHKERRARKSGRDPKARIAYTAEHLAKVADEFKSWKEWYNEGEEELQELFDGTLDTFKKILSATSQASTVKSNVGFALKAYRQLLNGKPFDGYMKSVKRNLERVRDGIMITGPKISEYGKAVEGGEGIAIDRHVFQLLYHTRGTKPSTSQVNEAKKTITDLAQTLGWKPQQLQSALWAAHIIKTGKVPETYHDRLRKLKHEGQLTDIVGK